jgi:hypothetical protein
MAQNYRIYINDNTLHLADLMPKNLNTVQTLEIQEFDFLTFYEKVKNLSGKDYVILGPDPSALFKAIKRSCTLIKAAGGLVQNESKDYLFIFRNGKWDLPKGKVEKGEKMKEASVREVEEECGVKVQRNEGKICKTYHVYVMHDKLILKKTNWYGMRVSGVPKLIPQIEEGITKAKWLQSDNIGPVLKNTFPSILQVLEEGGVL